MDALNSDNKLSVGVSPIFSSGDSGKPDDLNMKWGIKFNFSWGWIPYILTKLQFWKKHGTNNEVK